ncbi:HisA/HisF-related TIM barrel protein [Xanthovirga aplysinae]|uniref:1-(5-phosphoribosyl)-5-[(5- phosphoribosylamino)methylideneamino]imidazole-4- carboxamide isomerase n=1 Tax=Xanthovirga aplysinae TaxID=2529853 RepID=UPI0012BC233C|nr:1-(5-phosphoribosyl)-5-[(5-phosphoribosylamino)methylideneamino] imidazole-4-carboxamide isomerase [Xanthovirga aplysinae]MTI31916.1 1-(5-phosphoribosyl)-5-[(5-phosphoribosylamino)methylideneamino] imidazole-4-carboxamide isomerase [Xanthovirga aplysinae]
MIQIIPSIIIYDGKVVRLEQGDFSKEKQYDVSPVDLAKKFEDHGMEVVQLVDLDGARGREPENYHVLEAISGHTSLKIDFTGGINTDGDINKALECGASFITVSSKAVSNKELFSSWLVSYGREIIRLGADSLNKKLKVKGWLKSTDINIFDHIEYFYNRGLKYVKATDIARDGVLEGPSFELYEEMLVRFPDIKILANGGVRSVEDIQRLDEMGINAVIFGRAYYEGIIDLKDLAPLLV